MASYCEPMDIDDIPVDSEDKENAFRHNGPGASPRTPSEKIREDLDVSEINMKLRFSCTPLVSSTLEKHITGSPKKLFSGSEGADKLDVTITDNQDITMADWSMNNHNSSDSTPELDSTHTWNSTEIDCKNKTALLHKTLEKEQFNNTMEMLDTTQNGDDLSHPQSLDDPKPTSPIMRGLKSVLSMFRPSQSPIVASNNVVVDLQDDRTPDTSTNSAQASTPLSDISEKNRRSHQSASKIMSSHSTNSIVFNEDLINDLQWNDDSTIIFNAEKMPDIQSGSSFNSRGSVPSIDLNSETDRKSSEEIEVGNTTNVAILKTTLESRDASMNNYSLQYPSHSQPNYSEKLFSENNLKEVKETADSILEYVIEQAQKLVGESFTKVRRKEPTESNMNPTNNVSSEHLEIVSQHTGYNMSIKDNEQVTIENNISKKDETSSVLMINPNVLNPGCEIKYSCDDKHDILCHISTNVPDQCFGVPLNSNSNMSTAFNDMCVTNEIESSTGHTTNLIKEINGIRFCNKPVESCKNEENVKKLSTQDSQGENIGEEIVLSENTSPFMSINAPDDNIEFQLADNHQQLDYDTIQNPHATVLQMKMSPPESDVNCEMNKNPFTLTPTISVSPSRDSRMENPDTLINIENTKEIEPSLMDKKSETYNVDMKNCIVPLLRNFETDTNNILQPIIHNFPVDQGSFSLQECENHASALDSMSDVAPSGGDILQGDNSDAYLSADSDRECEQLLENEIEKVHRERKVIIPTLNIENLEENKTICLSPNCNEMPLTTGSDIENYFVTRKNICMSPSGTLHSLVQENEEVYSDAEMVSKEINRATSLTLSDVNIEKTTNISPERLSSKIFLKQDSDKTSSPQLKQEQDKRREIKSEEKIKSPTNSQYIEETVLNHKVIVTCPGLDVSQNITHIEKGIQDIEKHCIDCDPIKCTPTTMLKMQPETDGKYVKSNFIEKKVDIYKDILNVINISDLEKKEHIAAVDEISEPDFNATENPFATISRLSKSPLQSFENVDNSFDTSKFELSLEITSVLPTTRTKKAVEISDPFATMDKVRMSPCHNEICEKHESTNDTKVDLERQDTTHNLNTDKRKQIESKICDFDNSIQTNTSKTPESSPEGNVTVREVHTEDEDTMEGPDFEKALDSSFKSTTQIESSLLKNHNTSENNPLQVIMCDDIASTEAAMVDLPSEEEFMEYQNEEFRPGELFINADTFEFLMSQGTDHNTDFGKESLFLKFDPLCARHSSSTTKDFSMKLDNTVLHQPVIPEESPIAQVETPVKSFETECKKVTSTPENTNSIRNKTSTPENLNNTRDSTSVSENLNIVLNPKITPENFNNTTDATSASENHNITRHITKTPVNFNTTRDVISASEYLNIASDELSTLETINSTICIPTSMLNISLNEKPTMAVPPSTVSNETTAATHSPSYTPSRTERSMNFSSPAIAAIDRLISLSGSNSPVTQNYYVENTMSQETREAVVQIQDLLTTKEAEVNQLKQESKELQDKLVDLDIQMKSLQEDNEERSRKIEELKAKLTHKTALNNNMSAAVAEYKRAVNGMIVENEEERKRYELEKANLIRERDEQISHLNSMEGSFSDLHTKYERTKQLILTFKANEEILRRTINEYKVQTEKLEHNYESLKQQAITQLNNANMELEKFKRSHEAEVLKLNAQMRRKELHAASLEESLVQKIKANEELTAICDEIISKVG